MEEEIDLRPYIEAIIKHWYWIVGAAILAGLVAFGVSSLLPPQYEATALVAVTVPQELIFYSLTQDNLDPSFTSSDVAIPYLRAFPELAGSDQLLQELLQSFQPPLEDISSVEELREILEAQAGSDPTLIRLTATHGNPKTAAQLANNWAALYVPWANQVYGQSDAERLTFFETQLANAQVNLETAEDALVAFEAINRSAILANQAAVLTQRQADLLAEQNSLQSLTQDVAALRSQIEALSSNDSISFAHQLTALNLQLRTFNAQTNAPLQLQVEGTMALTGENRAAQIAFLGGLVGTIAARSDQIETDLAALEPQILSVQQQQEEAETQQNRLTRAYTKAEETYTALARNVESERLSAEDTTTGVRLASNSAVPQKPADSKLLVTLVVIMFFLFFGVILTVSITWVKR